MTVQFNNPSTLEDKPHRSAMPWPNSGARPIRHGFYRAAGKTLLDVALILLALPVVLPLIGLLALLVALDGSPPFYWQRRLGRNGSVFHILKLRTMVPDAERILEDCLASDPSARREWNATQKLRRDPRVTWIGRLLRKTSMDELPQLWNVLRGEMSLVGPRPMMTCQQPLYPGTAYYWMRPGITGLWQVADRNESSFPERADFDTEYYRSLSLKADMSILVRTIGVVMRGTGY